MMGLVSYMFMKFGAFINIKDHSLKFVLTFFEKVVSFLLFFFVRCVSNHV